MHVVCDAYSRSDDAVAVGGRQPGVEIFARKRPVGHRYYQPQKVGQLLPFYPPDCTYSFTD
eukprot:COSAG01_NODE_349_length_18469_cov_8.136364_2_plen_61_part_00